MSFNKEKNKIVKTLRGSGCYYLTVRFLVHPMALRLVFLAKKLKIHPNCISILTAFLSVLCLYFFYLNYFLLAFLLYYLRTVLDYTDGALARYTNKISKLGGALDRIIDEIFYFLLWLLIAYASGNVFLGGYFLISALLYRLIVDLFIFERVKLLTRRATIKQFFIDHGILLGCGVFTELEFWVLLIFAISTGRYLIIIPIFACNLDLIYRIYEVIKYASK